MDVLKIVLNYLDYCKYRKELDSKTIKAYRIDLKQYFAYVQCIEPDKAKLEEFITELHKKYKQKTIKRKLASVKAFYSYMEENDWIQDSPLRKVKVKFKENITLPRVIPRKEIEQLLNFMYDMKEKSRFYLRDLAIVETLFATGARVYEVSNIRRDCVDLETGLIRIMGKGGKERYIQIENTAILELLKKYYKEHETTIRESGYFFINQRGSRFTEQSMRFMIKKYAQASGIERKITPHMFRHSFATYLIEEGADISCVQQLLGHSSIRTTQIYIHVAAKVQAEILKNFHPRNRMKIMGAA